MQVLRFTGILSTLCFLTITNGSPVPESDADHQPGPPNCPDYCAGTANNRSLDVIYLCGDPRLGPRILPTRLPLRTLTQEYNRLGGLCPGKFLETWYSTGNGSYSYPPSSGFELDTSNKPIEGTISFTVGTLLDRFGSEYGTFVSPAGAPYMQRSLPPSNLDTPPSNPTYPYNYHVYQVIQSFNATAGPIAPWFGQPGGGTQYMLSSNIMMLLSGGFLEAVDPEVLEHRKNATICN